MMVSLSSEGPFPTVHGEMSFSLRMPPRQATGLIGPNGVGKSTLFHFLKTRQSDWEKEGHRAAFLDQGPLSPLGNLRGIDLLEVLGEEFPGRMTVSHWEKDPLLRRFSFQEKMERPIAGLSGGENQILKLVVLFFLKADLYFMDEPFTHLDRGKKDILMSFMKEKLEKDPVPCSMLIIDHHKNLLWEICRGVVPVLPAGKGRYQATTFYSREEVDETLWELWTGGENLGPE